MCIISLIGCSSHLTPKTVMFHRDFLNIGFSFLWKTGKEKPGQGCPGAWDWLARRKPIKGALATLIRLPVAAVVITPEGLDDGDPLTGGEILAEHVFVELTLDD